MRVGIVGPGYIGVRHIEAWRHLNVTLHGYARSTVRRAEVAAAYPEVTWHDGYDELLDAVEVVDLCTPTDTHRVLAVAAAAAGRHVICEKPFARTLDEAGRITDACAAAGVQVHVGHLGRYISGYPQARQAVLDGEVGEPTALTLYRGGAAPGWAAWFADDRRSGGVLLDLAIHDIDFARWVAGDIVGVAGRMDGPGRGVAELTHAGGARTLVTAEWGAAGQGFHSSFTIAGTGGELVHDSVHEPSVRGTDPMVDMLGEFRAAIRGGPPPRVTVVDAIEALRAALTAAASASVGVPADRP